MANISSGEKVKKKGSQKEASNKLDFLLDSIETEVANFADTVVPQDPILNETAANNKAAAVELDHRTTLTDDLDMDMDFFKDTEKPPTDSNTEDKEAAAALDALSEAEGEVETMLAATGVASDTEDVAVEETAEAEGDKAAAKALAELLASREIDASKFLEEANRQTEAAAPPPATDAELSEDLLSELGMESESGEADAQATVPPATDAELSEDLFSELGMESESAGADAEATEPPATDDELPRDLFSELDKEIQALGEVADSGAPPATDDELSEDLLADLEMEPESGGEDAEGEEPPDMDAAFSEDLFSDLGLTSDSEQDTSRTSAPSLPEEKSSEKSLPPDEQSSNDLLAELGLESAAEQKEVKPAEPPSSYPSSDNELATLMSSKIEALIDRLVEERLPAIAERIITEKLNKIIGSMK